MAKLSTIQMIDLTVGLAVRVNEVQQDPAVRKAWHGAAQDTTRAVKSVAGAMSESLAAWRRTAPDQGSNPGPLLA